MTSEEYIKNVTDQIRIRRIRPQIAKELSDHIMDQAAEYCGEGMSEEEAAQCAVREMGEPISVGEELNKIHRVHFPWKSWLFITCLFLMTIPMMSTMASLTERISFQDVFHFQMRNVILSVLISFLFCWIDYKKFLRASTALLACIDVLLLLAVIQNFYGYVHIGPFAMQAVSLVPFYLPLMGCEIYQFHTGNTKIRWFSLLNIILPFLFLILLQAFPTALSLLLGLLLLVETGKTSLTHRYSSFSLKGSILIVTAGLCASLIFYKKPSTIPPTILMGITKPADMQKAWLLSHWMGRSERAVAVLKSGVENALTDSTFLGMAAIYGKLPALIVVFILLLLSAMVLWLSGHQSNYLARLIGTGVGLAILLQTVRSVLSSFFSEYTLGNGLPIFSYGGTGMLMNAMILGMLLSIAAYKDVTPLELFTAVSKRTICNTSSSGN